MNHRYLLIPRIRVESANAFSSNLIINACPINAAVLFAHAIGRKLNEPAVGVAYIHHDGQHLGEVNSFGTYLPQQRRGASLIDKNDYASGSNTLSLQPTASMHLTFSVIIAFDVHADIQPDKDLHPILFGGRFAGGKIMEYGRPLCFESTEQLKTKIPAGFWVIDRSDELRSQTKTPLERLVEILGERNDTSASNSWLTATTLGYLTITSPAQRAGARDGHPHAFAEPIVGLVQYVSTRQSIEDAMAIPFWDFHWPNPETFLLKQTEIQ